MMANELTIRNCHVLVRRPGLFIAWHGRLKWWKIPMVCQYADEGVSSLLIMWLEISWGKGIR